MEIIPCGSPYQFSIIRTEPMSAMEQILEGPLLAELCLKTIVSLVVEQVRARCLHTLAIENGLQQNAHAAHRQFSAVLAV